MTKRQLIDQIITINRSAEPGFLARFDDEDLRDYLDHLLVVLEPRLTGETHRYEEYFRVPAATAAATAVLDTPEQEDESSQEAGVWSAEGADDADAAAGETDALVPSFIYDQQHSPPVLAPQTPQDDEEEQPRDEQPDQDEEDDNHPARDEVEYEDVLEDEPVPVPAGQYAEASFSETDEDMESWLF